jgi:hypothetical protein
MRDDEPKKDKAGYSAGNKKCPSMSRVKEMTLAEVGGSAGREPVEDAVRDIDEPRSQREKQGRVYGKTNMDGAREAP